MEDADFGRVSPRITWYVTCLSSSRQAQIPILFRLTRGRVLSDVHARHRLLKRTKHDELQYQFSPSGQPPFRPASQQSTLATAPFRDDIGTMIDVTGPKSRRERTFIGSECAVCEEPLEHTLRGERILQLSCSHVAHEACFYEYIKEFESQECPTCDAPLGIDTSRGGNLNFGSHTHLFCIYVGFCC